MSKSSRDLLKEKKALETKYNLLKNFRKGLIISEYTLPFILTSAITLGGAKLIFNASPIRENNKPTNEITTEEFDNNNHNY